MPRMEVARSKPAITMARVVLADRDILVSPKAAQVLLSALPDRQVVTPAGTGHAMMAEQPDAVLDALRAVVST